MFAKGKAALRPVRCAAGAVSKGVKKGSNLLAAVAVALMPVIGTGSVQAAVVAPHSGGLKPYVVRNDRGGVVRDRLRELNQLRASGRPVEIRGNVCFSTCTMLLGLPQTCVDPDTVFGFHGPSRRGQPLPPQEFEYYSQVIAQYYPKQLRSWYIDTGRKRINGVFRIKGQDIIRMGLKSC